MSTRNDRWPQQRNDQGEIYMILSTIVWRNDLVHNGAFRKATWSASSPNYYIPKVPFNTMDCYLTLYYIFYDYHRCILPKLALPSLGGQEWSNLPLWIRSDLPLSSSKIMQSAQSHSIRYVLSALKFLQHLYKCFPTRLNGRSISSEIDLNSVLFYFTVTIAGGSRKWHSRCC